MTVFLTWPFNATGGLPAGARTLPDRLAEVVNILDYGADRTGVADSTSSIQDAIDAAFGSSGSPHGSANATLNRTLKIPNGQYKITSPLILTDVVGGQILGAGAASTLLIGDTSIFTVNGCEDTFFYGFTTNCGGMSTSNGRHGIKLDAGAVGLKGVTLSNINTEACQYGVRVAPGGVGGAGIMFLQCNPGETDVCFNIEGPACQVTAIGGVVYTTNTGFWVKDGSLNCNMQFAGSDIDIVHDSTGVSTVYGTRSESPSFLQANAGTVVVIGFRYEGAGIAVDCDSPAVVELTGCYFGSGATGWLTGSGKIFLRNVIFDNGNPIFTSSFTGTICECATDKIFTFAQLPLAAEGLTVSMSNSNTATWGANITTTGANRVLARYNGSAWTVVGK